MSQTVDLALAGLFTYPSDISAVPQGSLAKALNISLSRTNLAEPRRGFNTLGTLPNIGDRGSKFFFYSQKVLVAYSNVLAMYDTGAFVSKGSITKPAEATSIRSVAANQNLYLTSSAGIKKLDATSGQLYPSGVPTALHTTLTLQTDVTNLALLTGNNVSYRWLLARKDANGNAVIGGVSPSNTISNASGSTKNVNVRGYLPQGIDTTYYAQLYRTTNSTTVNAPEYQLTIEYNLTGADLTNGYIDFKDITPDALLGASLYTNNSQEGIINNNAIAPLARDICEYKTIVFFADVENLHRYTLTLLAVGTGSALQLDVNDTITITSGATVEVYTAKATENVALKQFFVDTASSSPSIRIDNTIKSFINVVNRASALVYATVDSVSSTTLPGAVTLQGRTLGAAAFTTVSTRPNAFNPALNSPAGVNQTSKNDAYKNGLMYSKPGQPEAVPLKNIIKVGSSDDRIKRIVPLRDSLLIFKEKDGVYRLSGEREGNFSVSLLDSSAKLIAPDSVAVLNGSAIGLFETGICQVTDSDVSIVSQPVKDKLLTLFGSALDAVRTYSFGISYETEGKYILCLPTTSSDTSSNYQLIYDVFNGTFVEWNLAVTTGGVNGADGKLYTAESTTNRVRFERKTFDYTDFADYEQAVTLSGYTGLSLTVSGTDKMVIGDLLEQVGSLPAYITSVDVGNGVVTVDTENPWNTSLPVSHLKGIPVSIEWNRETSGNAVGFKHYSEISLPFKRAYIGKGTFNFYTDTNPGVNEVIKLGPASQGAWGFGQWGDGIWGGIASPVPIRLGVPRTSQRCNTISVSFSQSVAYSDWQLAGIGLVFNPTSVRTAQ
ncbi:MAG: hypothetical protein EOO38_03600 [Cytophagaceae bacterium]|nr:MAG: hypothetical protein EOO38_03600 [Cytophagaceae bacterium]